MKKLTFEELEMVTGGDEAAADAYLRELHKKYGGRSILMVLARATDEEVNHYLELISKKKIIIPEKNYREVSPLERRTAAGRFCSCAGETFSVFPLLRL